MKQLPTTILIFFSQPEAIKKLRQVGGELQSVANLHVINLHQAGGEYDMPLLLCLVPWRHQVNIITKCKSIDEAIFYLRESILGGWSRQTLANSLNARLYESCGKAISNFSEYLPEAQCPIAPRGNKYHL